ncbi:hypothetical protein CALVIDRAFT_431259 [Calocera viscosa TUFC12733]|uniref:Uncharacterized protein n=1 Tax=Calocera viscosa (strain TUFC12733) TaxID=1330018 RepID=A0A167FZI8_CALVF|nr:hypothetical protein CALVIDRAFT_431259 [Calocera viscosa TUFC12733]
MYWRREDDGTGCCTTTGLDWCTAVSDAFTPAYFEYRACSTSSVKSINGESPTTPLPTSRTHQITGTISAHPCAQQNHGLGGPMHVAARVCIMIASRCTMTSLPPRLLASPAHRRRSIAPIPVPVPSCTLSGMHTHTHAYARLVGFLAGLPEPRSERGVQIPSSPTMGTTLLLLLPHRDGELSSFYWWRCFPQSGRDAQLGKHW